jgi:hypothetical protein
MQLSATVERIRLCKHQQLRVPSGTVTFFCKWHAHDRTCDLYSVQWRTEPWLSVPQRLNQHDDIAVPGARHIHDHGELQWRCELHRIYRSGTDY